MTLQSPSIQKRSMKKPCTITNRTHQSCRLQSGVVSYSIDLCHLNAESPDAVWNDTDSGGPLSCLQRDLPKVSGVWILAYCVVGDSVGSLA